MASFVVLRHPVTILVTDLTNPDNLINDFLIFSLLFFLLWGEFNKAEHVLEL